jgi:hypothetical protein
MDIGVIRNFGPRGTLQKLMCHVGIV